MAQRKPLKQMRSREKEVIVRLSEHFQKHKDEAKETSFINTTAEMCGVSRRTVFRYRKEARETGSLTSPQRPSVRGPYKEVDDFDLAVIRNKVQEFYEVRHQHPTLKKLHNVLRTEIQYPGSQELLRKTLHGMGFSWKRTPDNRNILTEKPNVVAQRLAFYKRKRDLEEKGFHFVYVDETWLDTSYTAKSCWQGPNIKETKHPINKGHRLIVVDAGSRDGFVPGSRLIYKASASSGDYHSEMNGETFGKWLREKLLPNLPPRCAVVLDNASYHSVQSIRCPTSSTRKRDIQEWLTARGVNFSDNQVKTKLLELVRQNRPSPAYVIDDIVRDHGHEILRLPPYHPDFNPIELIWSQLKSIVRARNMTFRLDDLMKLTDAAFGEITAERWRKACYHVDKVIEKTKAHDCYKDGDVERFVINLEDTSSDDDNSDTETASMCSTTDTASETEECIA